MVLIMANFRLVHDDIGRGPLLGLICGSAVIASFTSMTSYVLAGILSVSTLGGSGIVTALIGASCVLHEG